MYIVKSLYNIKSVNDTLAPNYGITKQINEKLSSTKRGKQSDTPNIQTQQLITIEKAV